MIRSLIFLLLIIPAVVVGNLLSHLCCHQGSLWYYAVFLGWPVLTFLALLKFCLKDGVFINVRLVSFFLVEVAFALVLLKV